MSLINDMLKDLEKRRARSLDEPAGALGNLSLAGRAPSRRHIGIYIGVVIVALAVLGAAGYLAWQRLGPRLVAGDTSQQLVHPVAPTPPLMAATARDANVNPAGPPPVAKSAKSVSSPIPPATSPPPPSPPAHHAAESAPAVTVKQTAMVPVTRIPTPTARRPRAHPVARTARARSFTAAAGNVQKRQRPLSAAQRSALAYQRGYALLAHGQTAQGEDQLRRALRLDAHNLAARELLAGMYMRTGRLVEAAGLLKEGVQLAPGHTVFAELYARVLVDQGEPGAAVRVLEQHLDAAHDDVNYLAMLAALYQQVGRQREAAQAYRELVQARPDRGEWWAGLGISLEALGQPAAARQAYQRAQDTGNLPAQLRKYTAGRLASLKSSVKRAD